MARLYRLKEDYIVIRYSWFAASLPSEKICNLLVSEGLHVHANPCLLSAVRLWDEVSRDRAVFRSTGMGPKSRLNNSLADFLAKTDGSC
jgi:hypothetical protein